MKFLPDRPTPLEVPPLASLADLEAVAANLRYHLVQMSHRAGTPHLGSALSCVDILVALYWAALDHSPSRASASDRDRCILSKGHAATALYAALCGRGFFSLSLLDTYGQPQAPLSEQPSPNCAPGIELATGSLGHGLPVGVGLTLASRLHRNEARTVVILGDGECNEGSVWEAAMMASAQRLGRLTVVVDYNKWQATGRSDEVLGLPSLSAKWQAFGWEALEVDGHDINALIEALSPRGDDVGRPRAVIAHTVKGKGISFMEDDNNWHYRVPNADELQKSLAELIS